MKSLQVTIDFLNLNRYYLRIVREGSYSHLSMILIYLV